MSKTKDNQGPLWEIFVQSKSGQPHKHCGSLHAADAEMALQNARDVYTRRGEGNALWVVPASAIVASSPEDIGSFFQEISHPRVIKETVPKKINISLHNNQIAWNAAGVGYTYVVTITEHDNNKVIHKFPDFDKTAIELPIELLQTNRLYNISVKWKKASAEGPIENKSFSLIDNGNKINPECIK